MKQKVNDKTTDTERNKLRFFLLKLFWGFFFCFGIYISLRFISEKGISYHPQFGIHFFFLSLIGIYYFLDHIVKQGEWCKPFYKHDVGFKAWICIIIDWYLITWIVWGILYNFGLITNQVVYVICLGFFLYTETCGFIFRRTFGMFLFHFKWRNSDKYSRLFLAFSNPYLLVSLIPAFFTSKWSFYALCLIWGWRTWKGKSWGYNGGPIFETLEK